MYQSLAVFWFIVGDAFQGGPVILSSTQSTKGKDGNECMASSFVL